MFTSQVTTVKKVKWNGEDRVEFEFDDGCFWQGAKRKDFWHPDRKWEKIIKPGCEIQLWSVQGSTVVGFEVWHDDKFESVWCLANDFQTKKERMKGDNEYNNFIKSEGGKIAELIDQGKSLKQIDKLIDDGHSGNTYACALTIGIGKAKNRKNADKIRKEHNKKWGVTKSKGVVNPAVVTINTK